MNHPGVSGSRRRRCCVLHSISFCSRLTGAGDSPENQSASYSQPPPLPDFSQYLKSELRLGCLPLWALARWYRMKPCAAGGDGGRGGCAVNFICFFSAPPSPPPPLPLRQRLHFLFSLSSCSSLLPVSDSFSLSSSGGVGAGLLRPLRVGRVLKLHRSRQTRGKPAGGLLSDSDGATRVE